MKIKKTYTQILVILLVGLVFLSILDLDEVLGQRDQRSGQRTGQRTGQRGQQSQQTQQEESPYMPDSRRPFGGTTWIVGFVLTLGVVAVGFKNSRRTHLD